MLIEHLNGNMKLFAVKDLLDLTVSELEDATKYSPTEELCNKWGITEYEWRNTIVTVLNQKKSDHLRDARRILGISQAELALSLGIGSQQVSNFERGRANIPTRTLKAVLKLLDDKEDTPIVAKHILSPPQADLLMVIGHCSEQLSSFSFNVGSQVEGALLRLHQNITMMLFSDLDIRAARRTLSLTRLQFGTILGVPPIYISDFEASRRQITPHLFLAVKQLLNEVNHVN